MSVKAKFMCNSITPGWSEGQVHVRFHAVYDQNGENADFCKATPSGNLDMVIDPSTPASNYFERGKYYYLTIEQAPE